MLVTKFLPLLLAPFALASPVLEERADAAGSKKVIADVKAILGGIAKLNNTINTFQPSTPTNLQTALQIQQETTDLENLIKAAISDANASKKWNDNQSLNVAIATTKLTPKIKSLLNNIVAHKPAFTTVLVVIDLSQTVKDSLTTQKGLSQQLGDAITKKLTKTYAQLAPQTTKKIQGFFTKALKAYESCTGLICPPPLGG